PDGTVCPSCGASAAPGVKFCPECGAPLSRQSE
ncbi:MAG TPA: zinc-ribbon domain-containing protein, partial [Candidatus Evtepia faecigallinarum]|nr:zinc-ribbon domain-containing protein [Candidatus Evtepia faecigallinarum]